MGIEDRLGNKAESWGNKDEPLQPGDRLIGKIVGLGELPSDYGSGSYPTVEIEEKGTGKVWMWHAFDTVAKNELARQNAAVDDDIGTEFLGEKKTKGSSKYDSFKDWHVIIEKATGPVNQPNWDDVAEGAKAEGGDDLESSRTDGVKYDDDEEPF